MKNILKWFSALALSAATALAAEPLRLQWGTIDTSSSAAQTESAALKARLAKKAALARARKTAVPEDRAAYIVQFPGPVTEEWRTWLESATQVRGYLPEFAYLVWATPTEMDTIAANPAVHWTGEWQAPYKTVRARSAAASADSSSVSSSPRWMHVSSLLTGDDGAADLRARLEALPAPVRSAFPRLDGSVAVALLADDQLDQVAAWPDIEWLEPSLSPSPFNDQAALTNMMNVTPAWASLASGGLGLTGAGQIVAVADTGCDTGSTNDTHPDFAGRILAGYGWKNGSYSTSHSWADTHSHGTHCAGSVLGSGAASSNQFRGIACEAQLVVQGCQDDLSGIPDNPSRLLSQAYTAGARIHSDSWGYTNADYHGAYLLAAVHADGCMWTNQNFLMVIAAGNDGIDADGDGVIDPTSVTAPGTAKNGLCVGATENYRTSGGYAASTYGGKWPSDYPAAPIKSDTISQTNVPQGLAAFSGRGPTLDGRYKPDIVAPGTDIVSARSRLAESTGWGIAANTNYLYNGGTSMATPLTAGAAALVRQWLVERKGIPEPPAALLKALLVNGARDMTPGQYGTGSTQEITARPDRSQGFGHVNLFDSLSPGDGRFLHFATNTLTTSANYTTNIPVGTANAGPYRLTLAWQDYPGASGASKTLVNDLDLTVTSPSGTVYHPNNLDTADHANNIEFIEFTAAETGVYSVKVNGYSVSKTSPHGGQPFALVLSGPGTVLEETAPAVAVASAPTNILQYADLEVPFAALLDVPGYPVPAFHLATDAPEDDYAFEEETGFLAYYPSLPGSYTFACTASNTVGASTCTLAVTVAQPLPDVPADLAAADITSTSFTATWSPVPTADSYRLDVIQGDSFATAVGAPVLQTDFSSTADWTLTGTGTYKSAPYVGAGAPSIKFDGTGDSAVSPDFGSGVQLAFWAYGNGGSGSTFAISALVGGTWIPVETVSIAQNSATYEVSLPAGTSQVRFDFTKSVNCALDDVVVYGPGAETGEYVPGWSNATVNATSADVVGLQPATTYAVRVRAVNAAGASANSAVATATTLDAAIAPVWTPFPALTPVVGSDCELFVGNYVSGSPFPDLSMTASSSANADFDPDDGYFLFVPAAPGTYDFTFRATNSAGCADATLTVTATTSDFEQWLADHAASGHAAGETAPNGRTYWDNYLADIDPSAPYLAIQIADPSAGTFTIPAASTNRAYTLLWTTNLATGDYQQQDLGLGAPSTSIPFPTPADWYGGLSVTLP